jgi:hypothetical protein
MINLVKFQNYIKPFGLDYKEMAKTLIICNFAHLGTLTQLVHKCNYFISN